MSEYGVRAAWRKIGSCCVKYGLAGILVSLAAGFIIAIPVPMAPWMFLSDILVYSTILAIPVLGLMYIEQIRTEVREFPFIAEALVVSLVILGFAAPITFLGVLIIGATAPDYEGIERWLPDIEDRSVYELQSLQEIIADLQLSEDVQQDAERMLERARDKGLMKGRSFNEILGGVIYIVARDSHEPRTLDEISRSIGISNREIGNAYRYVGRELDESIVPPPPEDYVLWFADKLDLNQEAVDQAYEIIDQSTEENIISGKSSNGIAAAAMYLAANMTEQPRSMKEVSDTLNVTTVTIRQRGRDMVEELDLDNLPETMK